MPVDVSVYRFDQFTLDARERLLLAGEREISLRPKAFDTLLHLVARHGHAVPKEELLDAVWPETNISEAVLTHCVAEVRRALGDDPRRPRFVKTLSRHGYKFVAAVEAATPTVATPTVSAPPTAIAVLPFVNLSGDPDNEYFCDGLSEELINGLTKIRALRVAAHTSSFVFKGRDTDVREIGRQLNVGSVVEGSVRKVGDRLRISAQLINTADGYHTWSEQYDRRLEDVFDIQDEISASVLAHVRVELLGARPASRRPAGSWEAYRCYLQGRACWHQRFHGKIQQAMEWFSRAMALDPRFAPALTGLADCYTSLAVWGFLPPGDTYTRARDLATRAVELDASQAEGHATLGFIAMLYDWGWDTARRRFERALTLNPGHALTRLWYGHYLSIIGRMDEAIAEMRAAQDLDPLSPVVTANLGWTCVLARDCDRAIVELTRVLTYDAGNGMALFYLGYAFMEAGRYAEAIETLEKGMTATAGMPWLAELLALAHALAGRDAPARAALADAERRARAGYVPPSAFALLHLALGDDDGVLRWLERGLAEHDAMMVWLKYMPCFDRLHPHPRFQAVLAGLDLA